MCTFDQVDYEEDEAIAPEVVKSEAVANGLAAEGGEKDKKGSYVGIHSTGFRLVHAVIALRRGRDGGEAGGGRGEVDVEVNGGRSSELERALTAARRLYAGRER